MVFCLSFSNNLAAILNKNQWKWVNINITKYNMLINISIKSKYFTILAKYNRYNLFHIYIFKIRSTF
jgi:hypothetical protein